MPFEDPKIVEWPSILENPDHHLYETQFVQEGRNRTEGGRHVKVSYD